MGLLRDVAYQSGVIKDNTELTAEGAWTDANRVRFVRGLPQKFGGWAKRVSTAFTGTCRGLFAWVDADNFARLALGTHSKLLVLEGETFTNITPIRISGQLTNPFDTTSGSATVTVNHSAHGSNVGDTANYQNFSAVGGITIDGDYTIQTVDTNSFTIEHTSSATSTVSGGGTGDYQYEITVGLSDSEKGTGWGVGPYGEGTYGTARSSFIVLPARTWQLDQWNQFLVACHNRDGNIYQWELSATVRAAILANAPTGNLGIWITEEQHLVAYGAGGAKMRLEWCDQGDNTVWTPSDLNTAGGRTLIGGSEIRTGLRTRRGNLILADASIWEMYFVGGLDVFGFNQVAAGAAGLISAKAVCDIDGVVYWMGQADFYMYDGVIRRIPNSKTIRRFVYDTLDRNKAAEIFLHCNTLFSEIIFTYTDTSGVVRYIAVNYDDWSWYPGLWDRTAGVDLGAFDGPILTDTSSFVQDHETGTDDDGSPMNEYIVGSPKDIAQGNYVMDIIEVIPDFKDLTGAVDLTLLVREYPHSPEQKIDAGPIVSTTEELHPRASGRQVAPKISSDTTGTFWRFGRLRMEVQPGGQR